VHGHLAAAAFYVCHQLINNIMYNKINGKSFETHCIELITIIVYGVLSRMSTGRVTFSPEFLKTGGGEDVDACL